MSLTKIWIDCTGCVDDILALIILLDASDYDIVAISCVRGKTTVDEGIENIAKVLQVCKRSDIPLYRGSNEPLITPFPVMDAHYAACEAAARSSFLAPRKSFQHTESMSESHAAVHLVETAREMEGDLIVVSLGPFMNIAVACILDPLFPMRVGKFVAVGGSENSADVTQTAEFNCFVDPEAAQLVLHRFPHVLLITRDLGQKYLWNIEEEWLEKAETAKARLLEGILTVHEEMGDKIEWIRSTAIAAAVVSTPDVVMTTKKGACEIEVIGRVTRGQSVFQFDASKMDPQTAPNIDVITEIDDIQFHQVEKQSLANAWVTVYDHSSVIKHCLLRLN